MTAPSTAAARRECDLVMKGGVTSGVIYPRLIAELAKRYTFRSIGGTSAGAIAAAAAAAAQLGVTAGSNAGAFTELERLPAQLGGSAGDAPGSMLLNLFQPQPALRKHFAVLTSLLNAPAGRALLKLAAALVRRFPVGAVLGALPGATLLACAAASASPVVIGVLVALGALLGITGAVVGAAWSAAASFCRELPRASFGICNGMPTQPGAEALTPWLDGYLNALAGKPAGAPLTFAELWAGKLREPGGPAPADETLPAGQRAVHLAMMTTALNLRQPVEIPFRSGAIYFVEQEIGEFFPEHVARWLIEHARPSQNAEKLSTPGRTFRALPVAGDLPVIVGVRLSLSFPVLLAALPLYVIDWSLAENKSGAATATRVYFSDGGLSSNFPVHFFDSPLPTRPTFGVNLRAYFHPDHPGERVWLPEQLENNRGLRNYLPPLADKPGLKSVAGFVGAILDTMQNWRDHAQLAMPGFRDRIVHISHDEREGGLNLNMPAPTIEALAASGAAAAERLIAAFADGGGAAEPNGWDNHVRIRARTSLCLLQQHFAAIASGVARKRDPGYAEILADLRPPSYPFPNGRTAQEAVALLERVVAIVHALADAEIALCDGAPRPAADLRAVPRA